MALASRTFRVFVSSTFSDVKAERNALQEHVWPKLRELCMQHGCRFQAIDLRWGVAQEAQLDQQTMPMCLEEIQRCQHVTPRPNLIVLLRQRYGWRPLQTTIPVYAEKDTHDCRQKDPQATPGAQIAWTRPCAGSDFTAVVYSMQWINPRPDVAIQSLDMAYGEQPRGVPALIAVTAASAK